MLRLLQIEYNKLRYNKASRVLILTYFILLICIALFAMIKFDIGPIKFHLAELGIFNFPYIWHFNTFVAGLLKFFLLLVIVSMVSNEYSNKTLKQNLIDGLSKKEFILSKFYTAIAFSFVSTVFIFIVSLVLGLIYSSYTEFSIVFSDLEYLIAFFVKLIGFFSFGLFLGVLIKRSAFAVASMIVLFLIEFISYAIISGYNRGTEFTDSIYQFMPFKSLWNLIDEPGSRLSAVQAVANQVGEDLSYDYAVHWYEIAIVLGWTALFIFSLILLMISFGLYAQREASNWYFGENAGIQFDSAAGTVTALTDGQLNTREGCSSISDANGDLLFYSDGTTVWNRNHVTMLNGNNLLGNSSSTQSAIIVSKPSDPNIYYIFTVDTPVGGGSDTGLNYSEVDMTLDGGLGAVTVKNSNLMSLCSEKISAVLKDCVTKSLWVIAFGSLAGTTDTFNTYHAFEVTATGINPTAVTSSFPIGIGERRGYLKLSPNGTKMVSANMNEGLFLYDFDVTTGIVSNQLQIPLNGSNTASYGVEFAPNNELLYVHSSNDYFDPSGGTGSDPANHSSTLWQFDLNAADIPGSALILDNRQLYRGGLQLGPDGRIYRALSATYLGGLPFLGVINNPNVLGTGANYQHNAIDLNGRRSSQGLPPFDQSLFNITIDIIQNPTTTISTTNLDLCNGDTYMLVAPDIPGAVYTWTRDGVVVDDGDAILYEYEVTQEGEYEVLVEPDPLDCGDNLIGLAFVSYFDNPTATQAPPIRICDDNNDGLWLFDLTNQDTAILDGQDPLVYEVKYFESQADANANIDEIVGFHENNGSPQEIFARVQNIGNPNCFDASTSFFIEVFDTPVANPIGAVTVCDDDTDSDNTNGQKDIDLNALIPDVLGTSQNATDFTVTFHSNQPDAITGNAPLPNTYYNATPFQQTIYYRIENINNNSCYDTRSFVYTVNPIPASFNTTLTQCDEDGAVDGITNFNLTEADDIITGGIAGVTASYYLSLADAQNETATLNNINYTNTANGQILYVRIENDLTECFSVAELTLDVSITDINDAQLTTCDDDGVEDGFYEFTLSDVDTDVLVGAPPTVGVVYYETYGDALLEESPIGPLFTNNVPYSQIVYARAENANACFGISEIQLTVFELPDIVSEEDAIYCLNTFPDTITLDAGLNRGVSSDYSYLWSTGEITYDIQVNTTGVYTVTVTDANNCSKERIITVLPSNTATITDIDIVDATSNNTITILVTGEGDYEYALDSEFGPYQDSNIFEDVRPGLHTVYVRDKNNCGIIDEMVSVIGFPKFLTPNNDGNNDTWQVKGLAAQFQPDTKILIHDRYGKLVKQLNPLGPGWDGTFNGKPLPSDDYWFYVTLQDGRIFKSHFALKR